MNAEEKAGYKEAKKENKKLNKKLKNRESHNIFSGVLGSIISAFSNAKNETNGRNYEDSDGLDMRYIGNEETREILEKGYSSLENFEQYISKEGINKKRFDNFNRNNRINRSSREINKVKDRNRGDSRDI